VANRNQAKWLQDRAGLNYAVQAGIGFAGSINQHYGTAGEMVARYMHEHPDHYTNHEKDKPKTAVTAMAQTTKAADTAGKGGRRQDIIEALDRNHLSLFNALIEPEGEPHRARPSRHQGDPRQGQREGHPSAAAAR
jgi:hypothetical protein